MSFFDYYLCFFIFLVIVYSGALIWEAFFSKEEKEEEIKPPFYCSGVEYKGVDDDICDPFSPYYRSLCSINPLDSGGELRQNNFPRDCYGHHDRHHYCEHNDYDDYWDSYDSFDPCDPADPFYDDLCSPSDDRR